MICYHDYPFWKLQLEQTIFTFVYLSCDRSITTDSYLRRREKVCYIRDRYCEGLFRQSHICIVDILVDPVEWRAEKLSSNNTVMYVSLACIYVAETYQKHAETKYVTINNNRTTCAAVPCLISPPGCDIFPFRTSCTFPPSCSFLCLSVPFSMLIRSPNMWQDPCKRRYRESQSRSFLSHMPPVLRRTRMMVGRQITALYLFTT